MTYNSGVAANAYTRAYTMGHGALAVLVELVRHIRQLVARTNGSLPGVFVDAEMLEVAHVDDKCAVVTSNTIVSASVLDFGTRELWDRDANHSSDQ